MYTLGRDVGDHHRILPTIALKPETKLGFLETLSGSQRKCSGDVPTNTKLQKSVPFIKPFPLL